MSSSSVMDYVLYSRSCTEYIFSTMALGCVLQMYLHFAVYRGFHSLLLIQISCIEKNGRVLSISFVVQLKRIFFFSYRSSRNLHIFLKISLQRHSGRMEYSIQCDVATLINNWINILHVLQISKCITYGNILRSFFNIYGASYFNSRFASRFNKANNIKAGIYILVHFAYCSPFYFSFIEIPERDSFSLSGRQIRFLSCALRIILLPSFFAYNQQQTFDYNTKKWGEKMCAYQLGGFISILVLNNWLLVSSSFSSCCCCCCCGFRQIFLKAQTDADLCLL